MIRPDHEMPGGCDCYFNDSSVIRRMNAGNLWEHELNAHIIQMRADVQAEKAANGLESAWSLLMSFYQTASPWYYEVISGGITRPMDKEEHIYQFIHGEITLTIPYGSVDVGSEQSKRLHEQFPLDYGKVDLHHPVYGKVKSKSDILIAPIYLFALEKVGEYWSSTSVPRRQHHGVISKLSYETKNLLPYRSQAIRFTGETEVRRLMSMTCPGFVSSLLNISNNAELADQAVRSIITAESPVRIPEVVEYDKISSYPSVSIERINHLMNCYGLEYFYESGKEHTMMHLEPLGIDISDFQSEYGED